MQGLVRGGPWSSHQSCDQPCSTQDPPPCEPGLPSALASLLGPEGGRLSSGLYPFLVGTSSLLPNRTGCSVVSHLLPLR